jgi:hypothetical protein
MQTTSTHFMCMCRYVCVCVMVYEHICHHNEGLLIIKVLILE